MIRAAQSERFWEGMPQQWSEIKPAALRTTAFELSQEEIVLGRLSDFSWPNTGRGSLKAVVNIAMKM
ncbi:hypothetical protein EVAR_41710_1 [Eumeta japonica]|uniref:Uncharacterized protein n=1 Tax=Eumeta variegata TaxID=151549 RepID=A0A4C1XDG6_EUMVA|nr:hypothetical protein EVAR_41710_1 [Eumeta japonica]